MTVVPLLTVGSLAPLDGPLDVRTLIGFALGLVAFALVIVWRVCGGSSPPMSRGYARSERSSSIIDTPRGLRRDLQRDLDQPAGRLH